jgi:hypothetical protein
MVATATGLAIGLMLGSRFAVFALIPVLLLAAFIALASMLASQLLMETLTDLLLLCGSVQAGYLISAVVKLYGKRTRLELRARFQRSPSA